MYFIPNLALRLYIRYKTPQLNSYSDVYITLTWTSEFPFSYTNISLVIIFQTQSLLLSSGINYTNIVKTYNYHLPSLTSNTLLEHSLRIFDLHTMLAKLGELTALI